MVPLPLIIPVLQMITEKGPSNSPEEEPELGHTWHDATARDRDMESRDEDGQHDVGNRHDCVSIDIDLPAVEDRARVPQAANDVEFGYPRVLPNHDRGFRSFSSISAWSSRSSRSTWSLSATKCFTFRSALQRLWAFILQNDGRHKEEFIPNYRWLPIVSGVSIPFCILLQIPGLTERW